MSVQGPKPASHLDDVLIHRGSKVRKDAEISVVVMATDSPGTVADAVRSLLEQDEKAEIVVVNTGDGTLREHLAAERDFVVTVETPSRQYPGGTRNLGIRHSHAPVVAFLAADCLAAPGWLRQRLVTHRAGSKAVASAVLPLLEDGRRQIPTAAWATYAAMHARRMPDIPAAKSNRYGVSYDRGLFDEFGLFREDLRIAEDTEFNHRIKASHSPTWNPEIITFNRYPASLVAAIQDQFKRGRRAAAFQVNQTTATPLQFFLSLRERRVEVPKRFVRGYCSGERREAMLRARRLLPLLALSFGFGALSLYLHMPREGYGGRQEFRSA